MKYPLTIALISVISQVGLGYFVLIIMVMHKLRPDYDPRSRYISEYAVGKFGLLAKSSFIIDGLSILGIYWCLKVECPFRTQQTIGLTLVAVWGAAMIIMGFFDTDLKEEKLTLYGILHLVASSIGVLASVVGTIFLSFNFICNEETNSMVWLIQALAVTGLILAVLLYWGFIGDLKLKYNIKISGSSLSLHLFIGSIERLLTAISIIWLEIIVNSWIKLKGLV